MAHFAGGIWMELWIIEAIGVKSSDNYLCKKDSCYMAYLQNEKQL